MAKKSLPSGLLEKFVPILLLTSITLAFVVGILWQKVASIEGGGNQVAGVQRDVGQPGDTAPQPQGPTQGKLSEEQVSNIPEVTSSDHLKGNPNAKVVLIEYSDFECPFCSSFHPTAQQVLDNYGDDVAWVYRHFPLDQLHPKARPAAEASECVAELGGDSAFWAFVDEIFEDQAKLSDLSAIAASSGVDTSSFEECLNSEKHAETVEKQYQGGLGAGVTGTPGNFVVNDKGEAWLIPGALPYDQIKITIDEALEG